MVQKDLLGGTSVTLRYVKIRFDDHSGVCCWCMEGFKLV